MEDVSLYELNNLVRSVVEQTLDAEYWLQAELSEARLAANGHFYVEFIQKDAAGKKLIARARGTMWARTYNLIAPLFERATGERLRAGMKVRALVTIEFHELYGHSLNVLDIDPSYTMGDLARRRQEIIEQLEADGILDDNHQLELPVLLKRIAVISSAGAAGYGDFCDQLAQNDYGLFFAPTLFPAVMQGVNTEASVLAALENVIERADDFDCVVVIRGGGATSDLSDFDTYALAAAVAQMPLPVIVGIGHERDETVLDIVAHTSVKTPTAAAAFLIDHEARQLAELEEFGDRIREIAASMILHQKTAIEHLSQQLPRIFALVRERQERRLDQLCVRLTSSPERFLVNGHYALDSIQQRIGQAARFKLQEVRMELQLKEQQLAALDPLLPLKRGYSLTYTSDGRLVKEATDVSAGDTLTTQLGNGTIHSTVIVASSAQPESSCED